MQSSAQTIEDYLEEIPEERKVVFLKLREAILNNIPKGFEEQLSYGMLGTSFLILYILMAIIVPQNYRCPLLLSLPKKTLLHFITWEFMQTPIYYNGL